MKIIVLFVTLLLTGCATHPAPKILDNIDSKQVLIVSQAQSNNPYGKLTFWEKVGESWKKVFSSRAVLGRTGIANPGEKREGDGHTPSGIYPIGTAFGYAPLINTKLDYRQATENDFWVDDVKSPDYNKWVVGKPNAASFEDMHRKDNLYKLGAVIEYNTNPIVPGRGSAIFMHIWRNYHKATSGCIALSERNLRRLLSKLDKINKPVIIIEPYANSNDQKNKLK
jgi:L,D-peptidoglycan transpeptidase YkuD (ErfK/YbiS/YcfS/YnhG family)